jgi:hypothetical protein
VHDLVSLQGVEAGPLTKRELELVDPVQRLLAPSGGLYAIAVHDGDADELTPLDDLGGHQDHLLEGLLGAVPALHRTRRVCHLLGKARTSVHARILPPRDAEPTHAAFGPRE